MPVPPHAGQVVTLVSPSRGRFGNRPSGVSSHDICPPPWQIGHLRISSSAIQRSEFCCKRFLRSRRIQSSAIQWLRLLVLQLLHSNSWRANSSAASIGISNRPIMTRFMGPGEVACPYSSRVILSFQRGRRIQIWHANTAGACGLFLLAAAWARLSRHDLLPLGYKT
jgi:hypothetical protein